MKNGARMIPGTQGRTRRGEPGGSPEQPRMARTEATRATQCATHAVRVIHRLIRLLALVGKVHLSKIRGDGHPVLVYLPSVAIHDVLWAWRRHGCTLLGTGIGGTRNWSRSHLKEPVPPRDRLCLLTSKLFHLQNPPSTPSIVSDSARQKQKKSDTDINRLKSDILV